MIENIILLQIQIVESTISEIRAWPNFRYIPEILMENVNPNKTKLNIFRIIIKEFHIRVYFISAHTHTHTSNVRI